MIEAQEFRVVDDEGRILAVLRETRDFVGLELLDKETGLPIAEFEVRTDGTPYINLEGANGNAHISIDEDGRPGLNLYDKGWPRTGYSVGLYSQSLGFLGPRLEQTMGLYMDSDAMTVSLKRQPGNGHWLIL